MANFKRDNMETATRAMTDETTTFKTFEITIPEKYVSPIRSLIKSMGGKIKTRKCGTGRGVGRRESEERAISSPTGR